VAASIETLLRHKGRDVWSVSPDTTVCEAARLMAEKNIGALLVVSDGAVQGIVSERDYAGKIIAPCLDPARTTVAEIMTAPVVYVSPTQSVAECMALVTERRIRHLPVLDGARLVGLVSIGDLVKSFIGEQGETIQYLERYITGT
jgi:CBS domain-containing protein